MIKILRELFSSATVEKSIRSDGVNIYMIKNRFIKRRVFCFWCGNANVIDGTEANFLHNFNTYYQKMNSGHATICKHCGKIIYTALYKNKIISGRSVKHLRRRKMILESKQSHEVIDAQKFVEFIVLKKAELELPLKKTFTDTDTCPLCGGLLVIHFVPINSEGNKVITMGGCQSKECFSWRE